MASRSEDVWAERPTPFTTLRFDCSGCGAPLRVLESHSELRCDACDSVVPLPRTIDAKVPDAPIEACPRVGASEVLRGKTARCAGCGALFSAATLADACCHCDGIVAVDASEIDVPPPPRRPTFHDR